MKNLFSYKRLLIDEAFRGILGCQVTLRTVMTHALWSGFLLEECQHWSSGCAMAVIELTEAVAPERQTKR